MHPIERLRYVARSSGAPHDVLVEETARALATFHDDPSGLVTACRRIVARQLASGPLWWLCSRMLTAADPLEEARLAIEEITTDPTPRALAEAFAEGITVLTFGWQAQVLEAFGRRGDLEVLVVDAAGDADDVLRHLRARDVTAVEVPVAGAAAAVVAADVVVSEVSMLSPTGLLAPTGTHAAAAVAAHAGVPFWAVAGVGRLVPERLWEAMVDRFDSHGEPWDRDDEVVPLDLVTHVVGPNGLETIPDALRRTDCPVAPELFKADIT